MGPLWEGSLGQRSGLYGFGTCVVGLADPVSCDPQLLQVGFNKRPSAFRLASVATCYARGRFRTWPNQGKGEKCMEMARL
jgi:hypothetical protein